MQVFLRTEKLHQNRQRKTNYLGEMFPELFMKKNEGRREKSTIFGTVKLYQIYYHLRAYLFFLKIKFTL